MKNSGIVWILLAGLMLSLAGCGKTPAAEPSGAEVPADPGRRDGERFETTIILEGMEETVRYEHIINEALGFAMDYDYDFFARSTQEDRECFVSLWDVPGQPENYLEVTWEAGEAQHVADAISAELSEEYEIYRDTRELDQGGSCIRIEASVIKNTNQMAQRLQTVYIIPASDGCRVARAHCWIEEAEGFGRRFAYMVNTLRVLERKA